MPCSGPSVFFCYEIDNASHEFGIDGYLLGLFLTFNSVELG